MSSRHPWRGFIRASDEKPTINKEILKRVWQYAKPYLGGILGSLGAILITTLLHLLNPLIMRQLVDVVLPNKDTHLLVLYAIALFVVPLLSGAFQLVERYFSARVGEGVIYDLRVALYDHFQSMPLHFFVNTPLGEMISRLNNDVVEAQNAVNRTLVSLVTNVIQVASLLVVMFTLNWQLTLLSAVIVPLFVLAAQKLGKVLRRISRQQMEVNARMNANLGETLNIGGALLVKLFGRQQDETKRFSAHAREVHDLGIRRATTARSFMVLLSVLMAIGTALVWGLGGSMVIAGTFTLGTIIAFASYLAQLYGAFQALVNAPVEFATSLVSFERVFEVLDLQPDIQDPPEPLRLGTVHGQISFEEVWFKYPEGREGLLQEVYRPNVPELVTEGLAFESGITMPLPVEEPRNQAREYALEDINLVIEPKQLVALVGPSGAGKTTLTYLMLRLYDPTRGVIRLDGHDLRSLSRADLTNAIGMVTQEPYLFHDTILANLLYAKPDATREEVERVARTANIHQFISALPDGYLTVVGERGYRMSGGEKQRLALARVLLKNPPIMVLDEATSSLDSESEALIQEAMARVFTERTSIVIAHRLSTILSADVIFVMDRGRIVERGSHAALLQLNGLYAELYETQFRKQGKMGGEKLINLLK
ncbi:MAG TPA: ABC transporter [Anaerolineaceae bacterium]|nr:ABC transporter [Anaerolineaceae bacterium]